MFGIPQNNSQELMACILVNLVSGVGDAVLVLPIILHLKHAGYCIDGYVKQKSTYDIFECIGAPAIHRYGKV